jgi:hypothetical protein
VLGTLFLILLSPVEPGNSEPKFNGVTFEKNLENEKRERRCVC